jgi:hypothetical protein
MVAAVFAAVLRVAWSIKAAVAAEGMAHYPLGRPPALLLLLLLLETPAWLLPV